MRMNERMIGHSLIGTANVIRRLDFSKNCSPQPNLTAMQGYFLGCIYMNEKAGKEIHQKDLEMEFSLRRSTASGILAQLEQNGFLLRAPCERDARLKKLILTERSKALCEAHEKRVQEIETLLVKGFTEEELTHLLSMLERIRSNAMSIERKEESPS